MTSNRLLISFAIALVLAAASGAVCYLSFRDFMEVFYSTIQPHSPYIPLRSFSCPANMTMNQTGQVVFEITNPLAEDLEYNVSLDAGGVTVAEAASITITVAGNETERIKWEIKPLTKGLHPITVSAISEKDLSEPGVYKAWKTSFQQSCYVEAGASLGLDHGWMFLISGSISVLSALACLVIWIVWVNRKARST